MRGHPGQGEAVESVRIPRVLFKKGSTQLFTADIVKDGLVAILILDEDNDDYVITRPQRDQEFSIPGFPGRDFAKSRDPGIFRDGISLKFQSRDFREL